MSSWMSCGPAAAVLTADPPVDEGAPLGTGAESEEERRLACVVTYRPDIPQLLALIGAVEAARGFEVALIDNSDSAHWHRQLTDLATARDCRLIANRENRGIAHAHNQAIDLARRCGFARLLLLDQDSHISAASIERLNRELDRLTRAGRRVAAVGPRHVDCKDGTDLPFVRLTSALGMKPVRDAGPTVACDVLISSGCLFPVAQFDEIGPFDTQFFIDYVDIEWCSRARAKGFELHGVPASHMEHSIGEGVLRVLGRRLPVHAPQRQYYLVRNALLFARKRQVPMRWRLHLLLRAFAHFAIFSTLCPPRLQRLRWLGRGLWDGMAGRSGKLPGPDPEAQQQPL